MDTNKHRGSWFGAALAVALAGSVLILLATLTYAVAHQQVFV